MNTQAYFEFKEAFQMMSDQELVDAFNREVGVPGWVTARNYYLHYLREEFNKRSFDISAIHRHGLSLKHRVKLENNKLVVVK